jgi:hypothetical protein
LKNDKIKPQWSCIVMWLQLTEAEYWYLETSFLPTCHSASTAYLLSLASSIHSWDFPTLHPSLRVWFLHYHSTAVEFFFSFYFAFELASINNLRGSHWDHFTHAHRVAWTCSSLSLNFHPPSFLLFQTVCGGFCYAIFTCIYVEYLGPLHTSVSFEAAFFLLNHGLFLLSLVVFLQKSSFLYFCGVEFRTT